MYQAACQKQWDGQCDLWSSAQQEIDLSRMGRNSVIAEAEVL